MARPVTRRSFVKLLGAAPLAAPASGSAAATAESGAAPRAAAKNAAKAPPKSSYKTVRIGRLIAEARAQHAAVAERIAFISRGLLGVRYEANTLIGGPDRPEQMVIRDDAFDCVTFCETVLAGALARDLTEFEVVLRRIRYRHGEVRWDERNHYFSEWCRRNIENKICRPVAADESVTIRKTVNFGNLGVRRVSIAALPQKALLSNGRVASGDIIGFLSQRSNLDFFHTGLVMMDARGGLMLRHASLRRRHVIDEPLVRFIAANGVRHVALLRAVEPPGPAGA